MMRDPYEVLGLDLDASDEDVEAAYRRLVRQHHPDRHVHRSAEVRDGHAARMAEVTGALRLIRDPAALARHRAARRRAHGEGAAPGARAGHGAWSQPGRHDPSTAPEQDGTVGGAGFDYRAAAPAEFTTAETGARARRRADRRTRRAGRRIRRGRRHQGGRAAPARGLWWLLLVVVVGCLAWLVGTVEGQRVLSSLVDAVATTSQPARWAGTMVAPAIGSR